MDDGCMKMDETYNEMMQTVGIQMKRTCDHRISTAI